jgi:tetratricopeptide (TPR) repeat protein
MSTDYLGNAVTGDDVAAMAGINAFVGGMLAYETGALDILAAADAAPGHCLANAYAGMLHMLAEAPGADAAAAPYLAAAERAAGTVTAREAHHVTALAAWRRDDIDGAIAAFAEAFAGAPRDLLALKMLHYHLFNRGDFPAMLRLAETAADAAPEVPHVHGMLAFAYEQCHLLDDAEDAARRALALTAKEPWAQHALAHVMLTQGRIDEGAAFLEEARPTWTGLNSFMITHLWWHLALFYLSQGREADALAAYDGQVWAVAKDYSQDQIGAVSLLARMEMDGIDVGDRWADLGRWLAPRAGDVIQPFLSVQYLYGLARAGQPEADLLLAAIERAGERGGAWAQAALPLARGLIAHARGHDEAAVPLLSGALPHLIRLGGSHAQRDLFDQILLDSTIRAGDLIEAQQMLELRRAHDPDGVPLNRRLADVYARLGLVRQAAQAAARAQARLATSRLAA